MKLSEAPMLAVLERLSEIALAKVEPEEPKRIDMSVCIKSGILCRITVVNPVYGASKSFMAFYNAQIDMRVKEKKYKVEPLMFGHIHASPTGWQSCPIPEGFLLTIYWTTNGGVRTDREIGSCDKKVWSYFPITMFQITGIAKGWKL